MFTPGVRSQRSIFLEREEGWLMSVNRTNGEKRCLRKNLLVESLSEKINARLLARALKNDRDPPAQVQWSYCTVILLCRDPRSMTRNHIHTKSPVTLEFPLARTTTTTTTTLGSSINSWNNWSESSSSLLSQTGTFCEELNRHYYYTESPLLYSKVGCVFTIRRVQGARLYSKNCVYTRNSSTWYIHII